MKGVDYILPKENYPTKCVYRGTKVSGRWFYNEQCNQPGVITSGPQQTTTALERHKDSLKNESVTTYNL